jgi:glycosyltransferase involved in cell wall biosynthesis
MKLLVTLDFLPERGGIQRYLHGIVAHTYSEGDCVVVGCARLPVGSVDGCAARIVYVSTPISRINKKFSLVPLFFRCYGVRRSKGVALTVDCGNVYAGLAPWFLGYFLPTRYRVYVHGSEVVGLGKKTMVNRLLLKVLAKAELITANSGFTASCVSSLGLKVPLDVCPPRISLVQAPLNGNAVKNERFTGNGMVRILCVGRLVRHKGHDILLDAVSLLHNKLDWRLVIAGDGPLFQSLKKRCGRKGLDDRVEIKTGLSDAGVIREYNNASLFVLPSLPDGGVEGFGIVLLEAMAHRLPIVASNTGGVPEVLDNGACGVLVPPGDAGSLAAAILRIAGDPVFAQECVLRAGERLWSRYVWQ